MKYTDLYISCARERDELRSLVHNKSLVIEEQKKQIQSLTDLLAYYETKVY